MVGVRMTGSGGIVGRTFGEREIGGEDWLIG